ncbi:hypothetical protein ACO0RG_003688 [Hanseniaspora osmophila]
MFKFGSTSNGASAPALGSTTQQPQTTAPQSTLFGNKSTTAGQSSFSFGDKKPTPAPSTFSFGDKNPTPAPTTSLFGNKQSTPAPANSLFGNTQQQQQQQPQQAQPQITNPTASTSFFGNTQQAQSTNPLNTASTQQITLNKPVIEVQKDLSKNKKRTALNDLVEASKNLPSLRDSADIPNVIGTIDLLGDSVQLSLDELSRRAKELFSKTQAAKDLTRAHYLLAGSGLPIQDAESTLENLNKVCRSRDLYHYKSRHHHHLDKSRSRFPVSSTDLDLYLKTKKDENILLSIEQSLNSAAKDFDAFVSSNFTLESWDKRKQEVRESFGILMKKRKLNNGPSGMAKDVSSGFTSTSSLSSTPWNTQNKGFLTKIMDNSRLNVNENVLIREKFENYAKIIHKFNNYRQNQNNELIGNFHLCQEIIDNVLLSEDAINESNNSAGVNTIVERFNILQSVSKNKNTTENSKHYLEKQFLSYVDELYLKNLRNEGLPSTLNKVQAFVQYKLKSSTTNQWKNKNLTIVNNIPIWALIFYLLRAGCPNEALQVAVENKNSFKKVESSFLTYLKHYCTTKNNALPLEFQSKIHTEYNQHLKNAVDGDPYRLAVYKIIGKCDLSKKVVNEVVLSVEDWMWFHLSLITSSDNGIGSSDSLEHYSLADFQATVTAYGVSHFGANNYIQVLLLSGLYNSVVEYVLGDVKVSNELDSFHLIFCLHIYDLLNLNQLQKFVTLDKIFATYISSFVNTDPKIAVEYILLLPIHGNTDLIEICHTMIRELVLNTKEFSVLLGRINSVDGTRIPGVLEERYRLMYIDDKNQFLHTITERAARKADEDGRIDDSLLLYQLSEEYDIVFSIVNKSLSDLLSSFDYLQKKQLQDILWDETDDTNVIVLASRLANLYLKQNNNLEISSKIGSKKKEALLVLLKIVDVWRLYTNDDYLACADMIKSLDLLPIFMSENVARRGIANGSTISNDTNEVVSKNIPNLLILTMSCISHLIKQTKQSAYQTEDQRKNSIAPLKKIAKNCMTYVGMTYYKMSRETYSILLNMESEL